MPDVRTPTGIAIAAGAVLVVGAVLLAAALFPPGDLSGRVFVLAVAVGGYAALVPDLRALAAVTVLAALTFVGFLANRFGELTGASSTVWSYTAAIALAALLGAGYRSMRSSSPASGMPPRPSPTALVPRPLTPDAEPVVAPPDDPSGRRAA
ncbi:hypothetical protein [Micromonospora costi]|uniref:hypothetical protein n=1 Tax=Micromonospora costi TaxID=1530042 RepID=UPI0016526881|nr:hypothetical protein [Micromonospora costi]